MYAIIQTGGKQYKVQEGDALYIEKLPEAVGDKVVFDTVLALLDGDTATFGAPTVAGASVEATIEKTARAKKITVFKYKPKKGYKKKQGHRQPYTKVTIGKVIAG
jgi:ribosomal protein L21